MASNLPLKNLLLLLVFLSVLLPQPSVSTPSQQTITNNHHRLHGLEIGKISSALSDKGYLAMSIILQSTLSSLLLPFENTLNTTALTIFCPPDKAFFTPKYPQPPLTLIQYQIASSNLDRESLKSSTRFQSKIDTLLPGHPLVVTTPPKNGRASINDVKVTEWDIYNDGHVIVHGVEDFFDPEFQTLLYPWYDKPTSDMENNDINNRSVDGSVSLNSESASSWVKDMLMDKLFIMLAVVAFGGMVLFLGCFYRRSRKYSEYGNVALVEKFSCEI